MANGNKAQLAALMFTDIVGSVALQNRLGTEVYTHFVRRHDEIFKRCLDPVEGAEILNETGDGFLVRFDTPTDAVNTALRLQAALHDEICQGESMELCIGLHLGAVTEMEESVRGEKRAVGMAINLAARVMDLAEGNQILMTRAVFDDARQFVREHPEQDTLPDSAILQWPAHGRYLFKGNDDPIEIYEVGAEGMAPLSPPEGGNKAKRAVAADEEDTLGWRPGAGIPIPRMEDWIVQEKLGQGGFGEVWLAQHHNSKEERVFKFCFDPERLRSFRRELTLFRLLRDALGKRNDIAALYDVSIEMPPFYLESEYIPHGNLVQWIESTGGMETVSMETRLDILARTARATDAAHSVGIVHKDIKPSNILISIEEGQPRPRLGDFGIGAVTDASALSDFGITQVGFTQSIVYDSETGSNSMTQLYAPPEYLVGGAASPQGDIYSLGVMLYQLVVGNLKRPLASGWQRDVSDPLLAEVIEKCIDVDPHRRFESAGQIAERLETLEERREQLSEKERLAELRAQATKRRRFLTIASVACLGLICLTAYFATNFVRQKRLTKEAESLRSQAREMASHSDYLLSGHVMSRDRRADGVAYLARSLRNDPTNKGVAAKLFSTLANSRLLQPIHPRFQTPSGDNPSKQYVAKFDAASSRILAPNAEGMLTLTEAATGEPIGKPLDHTGETLRTARFIRDDTKVLAVTMEPGADSRTAPSRLRVWDVETRKLDFLSEATQHLWISDDSSYWITDEANALTYWDLSEETIHKHELPRPEGEQLQFVRKTRTGEKLLCVSVHDGEGSRRVSVLALGQDSPEEWKQLEWKQVAEIGGTLKLGLDSAMALSRDGQLLAIAEGDASVKLIDLAKGEIAPPIPNRDGFAVMALAFSPDSTRLVIGYFESKESSAVIWDLTKREKLPFEPTHAAGVVCAEFSPDGSQLLTGSMDMTARLWDVDAGRPLTEPLAGNKGWVVDVGFAKDGKAFYTHSLEGTVAAWPIGGAVARPTPMSAQDKGHRLWSVGKNGEWIAGFNNRAMRMRNLITGEMTPMPYRVRPQTFSIIGNSFFYATQEGDLYRQSLEDLQAEPDQFQIPVGSLFIAEGNSDGTLLLSPAKGSRKVVQLWHLDSEDPKPINLTHTNDALTSALSENGKMAATTVIASTYLWDLTQPEPTPQPIEGLRLAFAVELNHDGSKLLVGTMDGLLHTIDTKTRTHLTKVFKPLGTVGAACFSPDERFAACLAIEVEGQTQYGKVVAYDLETEEEVIAPIRLANVRSVQGAAVGAGATSFDKVPSIRFNASGTQLVVVWNDVVSQMDFAPTDESIPEWVPSFAEALVGRRLEGDKAVTVDPSELTTIREQLSNRGEEASSYDHWRSWLLANPAERKLSPTSAWDQADYGDYLLEDEGSLSALRERLAITPSDPKALARIARSLLRSDPQRAAWQMQHAAEQLGQSDSTDAEKAAMHLSIAETLMEFRTESAATTALASASEAVRLEPNLIDAWHIIPRALRKLGDNESVRGRAYAQLSDCLHRLLEEFDYVPECSLLDSGFVRGSTWRYLDNGKQAPDGWATSTFDDSNWVSGEGPFGFGDDREWTKLNEGGAGLRPITYYFRRTVDVAEGSTIDSPTLWFQRDDGIVVYLNGTEVLRHNMPDGEITTKTPALEAASGGEEIYWWGETFPAERLRIGANVLAVELHQSGPDSSDLHFEMELITNSTATPGLDVIKAGAEQMTQTLAAAEDLSPNVHAEFTALFAEPTEDESIARTLLRAAVASLLDDKEKARTLAESVTPEEGTPLAVAKAHFLNSL